MGPLKFWPCWLFILNPLLDKGLWLKIVLLLLLCLYLILLTYGQHQLTGLYASVIQVTEYKFIFYKPVKLVFQLRKYYFHFTV